MLLLYQSESEHEKRIQLRNDSNTLYSQNSYLKLSQHICFVLGSGYFAGRVK